NGLSGQAEDISYSFGPGRTIPSHTYQAYHNNPGEYYKRLAYADTIGFMLENNNTDPRHPWGHLFNLAAYDPLTGPAHTGNLALFSSPKNKELQTLNAIGIDIHFYKNSNYGQKNDGLNESSVTTHRFGWYQGHSYVTGIVYQDLNNNGFYDPGEGLNGIV